MMPIPDSISVWLTDTDPRPLERDLKKRSQGLSGFAAEQQRELRSPRIRLWKAISYDEFIKMPRREFSSWTDDVMVAQEYVSRLEDAGHENVSVITMEIPREHILLVPGREWDFATPANEFVVTMDKEYIVMHHIPVELELSQALTIEEFYIRKERRERQHLARRPEVRVRRHVRRRR